MAKGPKRVIHRSSKTGEFVTKEFADKHKSTTEREHIDPPTPPPTPPKKPKK